MADLTIAAADVRAVQRDLELPAVALGAITAGQPVLVDGTTGKVTPADASSQALVGYRNGIALKSAVANQAVTILIEGILEVGAALAGLSYGDPVYISDTTGTLADAAGTVPVKVAIVIPGWGNNTPDKLLLVSCP